jgi:hypothetical protein
MPEQDFQRATDWRQVLERYARWHQVHAEQCGRLGRIWNTLAYVRGGLFLTTLALGFFAWQNVELQRSLWIGLAALAGAGFLVVVYIHDQIDIRLGASRLRSNYFARGMHRVGRQWNQLPVPAIEPVHDFRAISRDLDLFGSASLVQLLSAVATPMGWDVLRNWLCTPASPDEIRQRQEAVEDLAGAIEWRETFQLTAAALVQSPDGPRRFIAWADSPTWLRRRPPLIWGGRLLALSAAVLLVGFFTGWVGPQVCGFGLIAVVAANFLLSVAIAGRIHELFNQVSSGRNEVDQYLRLFRAIEACPSQSAWIRGQRLAANGERGSTIAALNRLSLIVWLGNLRRHGILFLLYVFLQLFFLWDVHIAAVLEGWQARWGKQVRGWFAALGRVEALSALGTLAYENPGWCTPAIQAGGDPEIVAAALGHPLLPHDRRVCNDVRVGPRHQVLLVTGSNMSGKSTLLRAIGVNVVLAQMGSVVCARQFTFPPVELETSMRIADSLSDGVSFFMAELKRLKQIVDHSELIKQRIDAGDPRDAEPRPAMLFLLDEILQGTNSRERHIAVNAVLHQLLANGAIGAVTTHDLELAHSEGGLGNLAQPVYFTESFSQNGARDEMTFDYVMRPGIAPTTNAIKLLRLVGLRCEAGDRGPAG